MLFRSLVALSLAVAAIPEALPAIVSISLALGARKMLAQRALVRRLSAVDTLGSVTFICSDKTGTLTANEMRAERYYCDGRETHELADSLAARTLLQAMAVSHDAAEAKDGRVVGDPTEVALLMAARDAGLDSSVERMCSPRVAELPFDSDRKRMTTVHREADGSFLAITKGAAEVVIALSKTEQQRGGAVEVNRAVLTRAADSMAAEGLRVLAVGVRRWASLPPLLSPDSVERDLEFIGLVGLIDPPRPEVAEAVAACKSAGVVPVMITGDHPLTARAIARRLGLLEDERDVLTGPEVAGLSAQELANVVSRVRVYARVAPEQKVRIVNALQAAGFKIFENWNDDTELDPASVDWNSVHAKAFPYRIRQNPGAGNALGYIFFPFPNKYGIYMHDTASRWLFTEGSRNFSHGCIRLQNPLDFAEKAFGGRGGFSKERVRQVIDAGQQAHYSFPEPITLYVKIGRAHV